MSNLHQRVEALVTLLHDLPQPFRHEHNEFLLVNFRTVQLSHKTRSEALRELSLPLLLCQLRLQHLKLLSVVSPKLFEVNVALDAVADQVLVHDQFQDHVEDEACHDFICSFFLQFLSHKVLEIGSFVLGEALECLLHHI